MCFRVLRSSGTSSVVNTCIIPNISGDFFGTVTKRLVAVRRDVAQMMPIAKSLAWKPWSSTRKQHQLSSIARRYNTYTIDLCANTTTRDHTTLPHQLDRICVSISIPPLCPVSCLVLHLAERTIRSPPRCCCAPRYHQARKTVDVGWWTFGETLD